MILNNELLNRPANVKNLSCNKLQETGKISSDLTHSVVCSTCGYIIQEGHYWRDRESTGSTVSHNVICASCNATMIEGHTWIERPATNDRICSVCGQTDSSGFIPIIKPINSNNDEEKTE